MKYAPIDVSNFKVTKIEPNKRGSMLPNIEVEQAFNEACKQREIEILEKAWGYIPKQV